jgi:hypothetical protein
MYRLLKIFIYNDIFIDAIMLEMHAGDTTATPSYRKKSNTNLETQYFLNI